jgi:hypothetical protein
MITVTLGEAKPQEKPFPKLMISDSGDVFYMVREKYGLPLTGSGWGFHQKEFADFSTYHLTFTDYNEPVTIQNQ